MQGPIVALPPAPKSLERIRARPTIPISSRALMTSHQINRAFEAPASKAYVANPSWRRGPRAARLRLAIDYVLDHLADAGLNAERAGKYLSVSGRAVQMLFEAEGTTFSSFVREQRLHRAFRQLRDPGFDTLSISQIAYAAGFVDLSHFNRCFRRRFGDTPSGVRRVEA